MYGTLRSSASRIFLPDRLGALVDLGAQAAAAQRARATSRAYVEVAVGDRQHGGLHRRQPERELARVVLDQDPDEALERAQQRAVDHHRPVLGVVGARVGELEALGHVVVELHGAELPRAADRVGHVQVDLRAVEGAVALVEVVLEAAAARARRSSAASARSHISSLPTRFSGRVDSSSRGSKPNRS